VIPHRKKPGRDLMTWQEEHNTGHRRVRARVEHVIGRMKNWSILRNCRRKGQGVCFAARVIAFMHNYAATT